MADHDLDRLIRRGDAAGRLLADDLFQEILVGMEQNAISQARAVPAWLGPVGDRQRRILLERANLVNEIRRQLQSMARSGTEAARKAERKARRVA